MTQTDASKIYGTWNTLFVGPNTKISKDLGPLLSRRLASHKKEEFPGYPSRHQLSDLMRAELDVCFLDAATDTETALTLIPELLRFHPKLPIVTILAGNGTDLVLRCLRAGASDFLIQPFTEEQVDGALQKINRLQPGRQSASRGKVFCVMPAKGGCGASTIACNLAYQWKRLGSKDVLLADLDPLAGTLSFLLKIKSNFSFMDALQRSGDIDGDLWKAMVVNRQGVDVLLAPETMVDGMSELADTRSIVDYSRSAYDTVILDANGVYGDWNLSQANHCDELLLVTTNELTSLQAVQRALTYLEMHGVGRWKVKLIVNRYDKHVGLGRDVIGTALHTEIYCFLPSDYEALQKSLMEGKQIPPASHLGKSLAALADRLAGREESAKKSSSLASLRSLFSRTSS
ncbi:MAG TPA: AAA family ATPase [Bryobacteraceae bacterium]|nr:AAA family ATPase [Bryobacteraceae bacterium]